MRAPKLASAYDRKRLLHKAKAILRESRPALERLHVMTPPALPYPHSAIAQQANAFLYQFTIGRGSSTGSAWTRGRFSARSCRSARRYIRRIPRELLIYYCVDKWSAFEGFDPATMERGERELCEAADLVIASAQDLAERCARFSTERALRSARRRLRALRLGACGRAAARGPRGDPGAARRIFRAHSRVGGRGADRADSRTCCRIRSSSSDRRRRT